MLPLDHKGERVQKGDVMVLPFCFQVTAHAIHSIKLQISAWQRNLAEKDSIQNLKEDVE